MSKIIPLIGRRPEIKVVRQAVASAQPARRLICLVGPGGVGKTRLLQSLNEELRRDVPAKTILARAIIDFDDSINRIPDALIEQIVAQVNEENAQAHFAAYQAARLELVNAEMREADEPTLREKQQEVIKTFLEGYRQLAGSVHRIVLWFDTLEVIGDSEVWEFFRDTLASLPNTVFVMAGRASEPDTGKHYRWVAELQARYPDTALLPLASFTPDESRQFVREAGLVHLIEPDSAERLHHVTGGQPILLALAAEVLQQQTLTDEQLQNTPQFVQSLVEWFVNLIAPRDVFLYMAILYRRFDAEILSAASGHSCDKSDSIIASLQDRPFVKRRPGGMVVLHDKMRDLIIEYVWPKVDPTGQVRADVYRRVVDYYTQAIQHNQADMERMINALRVQRGVAQPSEVSVLERLPCAGEIVADTVRKPGDLLLQVENLKNIKWTLYDEQWEYASHVGLDSETQVFARAFDDAERDLRKRDLRQRFLTRIQQSIGERSLSPELQYQVDLRTVTNNILDEGLYAQAHEAFTQLLDKHGDQSDQRVTLLLNRGNCAVRVGRLQDAIADFVKCRRIAEQEQNKSWQTKALLALGWVYRLDGQWDEAIDTYETTLERSQEIRDWQRTAAVLNNLGYVLGLQDDLASALVYCEEALRMREELDHQRDIMQSCCTLCIIHRHREDYSRSLAYAERALGIARERRDVEWEAKAILERGITDWYRKDPAQNDLENAERDLWKCIELCEPNNYRLDMIEAYHRIGHVRWEKKEWDEATRYFEKSLELSRGVSVGHELNNLDGLLEMFYERDEGRSETLYEDLCNHPYYAGMQAYRLQYENRYSLYYGGIDRILGAAAQDAGRLDQAIAHYLAGYKLMALYRGYSRYLLPDWLNKFLSRKFDQMLQKPGGAEVVLDWCAQLRQAWEDPELQARAPVVFSFCRRYELRAKRFGTLSGDDADEQA